MAWLACGAFGAGELAGAARSALFMLLWVAFAVLTAAVLAFVLAPLVRPVRPGDEAARDAEAGAIAVYRDQLRELEAEQARGLVGAPEAEAARLEISRRILARAAAQPDTGAPAARAPRAILESRHASFALIAAIAVPLLAMGLYLARGSPGLYSPSSQAAAREEAAVAGLVARVEARLRAVPGDGKGWEVIAPVYLRLGRFRDAADAYANAARLQGESMKLLAGLAESSVLAADGIVTDEARAAYEKMLKIEPGRVEPRFWLAVAKEQAGNFAAALADYKALLDAAPPQAPYRAPVELRVREASAQLAAREGGEPAGPTAADMAAAARLDPAQRDAMIAQMVDGLAQRLKSNGRDLPGWLRLLRAYSVLDRKDDARAALAEARRNFTGDAGALSELSRLAATLGLDS
jgi:cytochrome c-type biogenesis protein CcmH